MFQAGLLENTVQSASRNVNARMTGNGHDSWFVRVLEVTMTAAGARQKPAVSLDELDNVANLHFGVVSKLNDNVNSNVSASALF